MDTKDEKEPVESHAPAATSSQPKTTVSKDVTTSTDAPSRPATSHSNTKHSADGSSTTVNGTSDSPAAPAAAPATGGKSADISPEETRSKGRTALIMIALCMAVFLAALDITIITTALPTIAEHFKSASGYTWIGSGYLLGAAASTPIWGKISDIFGRKPILLIANVVFMAGSLIAALSINIGMLIAARVIQGIGGGGLLVLVNICIGDLFSMRSRGQYYGMVGGTWALASATGPLIGGAFTQEVTWRWLCFYINLPLDGVAFLIILFFLNNLHTPKTPILAGIKAIDWLGALAIVGGTFMILFGLQSGGGAFAWDSATVICLIIFGVVIIGLFFVNEWRLATYPVIPLHVFSYRSNIACLAVCFFHGFTFIGSSYFLPLYFQACLGATPLLSGVYTLATALPLSTCSMFTGIYIKKTGKYLPPIIFGLMMMTLGNGLFIDLDAKSSWAKIFLYQIVAGIGVGPLFQAPLIALQSLVPKSDIAAATATFQFIRNIGTAISIVVGSVVFQNKIASQKNQLVAALGPQVAAQLGGFNAGASVGLIDHLPAAQRTIARGLFAHAFHYMWIMYVSFSAAGLLASFLITRQVLDQQHSTTKTGLEAEETKRKERIERRRQSKLGLKDLSSPSAADQDLEKAAATASPVSPTVGKAEIEGVKTNS